MLESFPLLQMASLLTVLAELADYFGPGQSRNRADTNTAFSADACREETGFSVGSDCDVVKPAWAGVEDGNLRHVY